MNSGEFIRELEYLLQDIPDADREDAVAYYRDYLEEAGPEGEEAALREFGSPERVAAIIRSDWSGVLEDGGEFTEAGYQDERFRDPNFQLVERRELPEMSGEDGAEAGAGRMSFGERLRHEWDQRFGWRFQGRPGPGRQETWQRTSGTQASGWQEAGRHRSDSRLKRFLKVALLLVLLAMLAPTAWSVGTSVAAVGIGIVLLLAVLFVGIGLLTAAAFVGAVACVVAGICCLLVHPGGGILLGGIGMLLAGLGLIGIAVSVLVYGEFLPYIIRSLTGLVGRMFRRERRR